MHAWFELRSVWTYRIIVVAAWLAVWQAVGQYLLLNPSYHILVATPYQVLVSFALLATGTSPLPAVTHNTLLTLYEIVGAFALAAASGLSIGMLIGQFKLVEQSLEPLIVALLAVPNFVLFPIMFLLLSIGPRSDIAFGAYLGFFPVIANTIAGTRQVDRNQIILAKSMGASSLQVFRKVVLPSSAGPIVSGLKQGLSLSIIGVIGGEILAPISGIGYLMTTALGFFYTPELYALIILTVVIAVAGNVGFSRIERRFV